MKIQLLVFAAMAGFDITIAQEGKQSILRGGTSLSERAASDLHEDYKSELYREPASSSNSTHDSKGIQDAVSDNSPGDSWTGVGADDVSFSTFVDDDEAFSLFTSMDGNNTENHTFGLVHHQNDRNLARCSCADEDASRCVQFTINNRTPKRLRFLGAYFPGKRGYRRNPYSTQTYIQPWKSICGHVRAGWPQSVKGAFIYEWGDHREKVVFYMENPHSGGNTHGIKYYWKTYNSKEWYYLNVPEHKAGNVWQTTINGWFTIKSWISGGNDARALFFLGTGTCGNGKKGDGRCSDGRCCSRWGYCGSTAEYCK